MTPAARLSAAIAVLDRILGGEAAEQALTNWGRASRYAGSGDRSAVRDIVYDALRCRRSFGALGGGETGRGLVLGALRAAGTPETTLFTGEGHAPAAVTAADAGRRPTASEAWDLPDWLIPRFEAALEDAAGPTAQALRQRAPVFLRVNRQRSTRETAAEQLLAEGIETRPHDAAPMALEVVTGQRKIQSSRSYRDGLVELQDAASQAVVELLPLKDGMKVLDYCAGGGGKTLAMAARARLELFAHDATPRRMADLPVRAKRAGARVSLLDQPERRAPFDLVLADAPCSGSGSWRRDPQGKWALTAEKLASILKTQAQILDDISKLVTSGGYVVYATCSILREENEDQVAAFLSRNTRFRRVAERRFSLLSGCDGFFVSLLSCD